MKFDKFDRIVCINLKERKDRLEKFQENIPDELDNKIDLFEAVDGKKLLSPNWWPGGPGGYGCYLSHKNVIEKAILDGCNNIFILEDDAEFLPDFYSKMLAFNAELPDDAEYVFYGGQLSYENVYVPEKVSEHVYRTHSVERTHAYALFGQDIMRKIHQHLSQTDWHRGHVDSRLTIFQHKIDTCYSPDRWLVKQANSFSNLMNKEVDYNFKDIVDCIE